MLAEAGEDLAAERRMATQWEPVMSIGLVATINRGQHYQKEDRASED
jgi:hypothetical protein